MKTKVYVNQVNEFIEILKAMYHNCYSDALNLVEAANDYDNTSNKEFSYQLYLFCTKYSLQLPCFSDSVRHIIFHTIF